MATTTHYKSIAAVAASLVLALLAACGSGDGSATTTTTTEAPEEGVVELEEGPLVLTGIEAAQHGEWLETMGAMCVENFDQLPDIPSEPTPDAVSEFLAVANDVFERRVQDIDEIGPPLISEAAYRDFRQYTEELAEILVVAAEAADRGDQGALLEVAEPLARVTEEANQSSLDLGLDGCVLEGDDSGLPFQQEPVTLGDDPQLDELWHACYAGEGARCDELREQAPMGSVYVEFATTCGGRFSLDRSPLQCDVTPESDDDPETYGDDESLDALWDACEGGDGLACDDLYWSAPADSDYAAFGSSCGGRFEPDDVPLTCEDTDA